MSRPLRLLVLTVLLTWHALHVGSAWSRATASPHARDFASYHYAVAVAFDGGDPYDKQALAARARDEGTRTTVYPYLYPPPFLLALGWTRALPLQAAYLVWFWVDAGLALVSVWLLGRWWRGLGESALAALAALALCTAVTNNHLMGQANFLVLALSLGGLLAQDRGRDVLGGALLGTAVVLKASPVLLVIWWLLTGRYKAALAALAAAALWLLLSAVVLGPDVLVTFVVDVMPSARSGAYNGLGLPVELFGNHSLPNLWSQALGSGRLLSTTAQVATAATSVLVLGTLGVAWRRAPSTPWTRAAQASAVMVTMLLLPVFTYEHHLVWALPAVVVSVLALGARRLGGVWSVPLGIALVAWAFELQTLRSWSGGLAENGVATLSLQEAKSVALIVLWAATVWLGRRG